MEDRVKKNSSLEMDDVELDCAPVEPERMPAPEHMFDRLKNFQQKDTFNEKFDSGIDSFNSLQSRDSGLSCEFMKQRHAVTEPTVSDVGKTFENLNIGHGKSKEVEHLSSLDEGFFGSTCSGENLNSGYIPSLGAVAEKPSPAAELPQNENVLRVTNPEELVEIFSQDNDGDSQLHMAIIQLLSQVALYFISKAPHFTWLNLANDLQQTPLHLAVITRLEDVVRRLVVGGASVDMRDHKGDTPLHIACREGFDDIAATLLTPVTEKELQENIYETIYQMIPQDLEARNYDGQTCLHLAAEGAHLPVLKLLLSRGANINAQDSKSGRTALHYAAESGNMVLLEFLLLHPRLNVNAKTYGGCTPVMLAQGRGHQHVIQRLVSAGAIYEPELSDESDSDEEMDSYDDICIGGQRVFRA